MILDEETIKESCGEVRLGEETSEAAWHGSTVQYSTVQYNTVQYSTVQYNTIQYSTVQYSTGQDRTGQDRTTHFDLFKRTFHRIAGMSEIASAQSEKDSLRVVQQVRADQSEEWCSFLLVLGAYYEDALGCQ